MPILLTTRLPFSKPVRHHIPASSRHKCWVGGVRMMQHTNRGGGMWCLTITKSQHCSCEFTCTHKQLYYYNYASSYYNKLFVTTAINIAAWNKPISFWNAVYYWIFKTASCVHTHMQFINFCYGWTSIWSVLSFIKLF